VCFTFFKLFNGIYPEILEEIGRLEKWEIEWVLVSWLDGLQKVEKGEVDLLGPIAFSKERLKRFKFNRETIFVEWGQIYVSNDSTINSIIDLTGIL